MFFLTGCVESLALLGPTTSASSGKIIKSSLQEAVSYGIKKTTGKSPLGHALAYAKENNPEKKKEPCISFIKKTNSEICKIIKKKISSTKATIKEKIINSKDVLVEEEKKETNNIVKSRKSPRELAIALQFAMKEKSKIKYLDQ